MTSNTQFAGMAFNLVEPVDRSQDPELVKVAGAVYDAAVTSIGRWARLTDIELTAAGIEPAALKNERSGFEAAIYAATDAATRAVAFAGTTFTSLADWTTNLAQGMGMATTQYQEAVTLAKAAKAAFGDDLVLTGHSLGGGLASAAAAATGATAVVFNPAGVHANTYEREGVAADSARAAAGDGQVRSYVVAGEILNAVQTFLPIPKAAGQKVVLPDPAPLRPVLHVLPGAKLVHAVGLHTMPAVEAAMDKFVQANPRMFQPDEFHELGRPVERDTRGVVAATRAAREPEATLGVPMVTLTALVRQTRGQVTGSDEDRVAVSRPRGR
jgi:hypothetical protein